VRADGENPFARERLPQYIADEYTQHVRAFLEGRLEESDRLRRAARRHLLKELKNRNTAHNGALWRILADLTKSQRLSLRYLRKALRLNPRDAEARADLVDILVDLRFTPWVIAKHIKLALRDAKYAVDEEYVLFLTILACKAVGLSSLLRDIKVKCKKHPRLLRHIAS